MSTATQDRVRDRPRDTANASTAPPPRPGAPAGASLGEAVALVAVITLLVAAALPLSRVFLGWDWLRPLTAAVLLAVGVSWGARRLGLSAVASTAVSVVAWAAFVSLAFLSDTLAWGFIPTWESASTARAMAERGVELISERPAPTAADPPLLALAVTGMWAIAYCVDTFVFRLAAPVRAVGAALIIWLVPLAMQPTGGEGAWLWSVPVLAPAALLLLLYAGSNEPWSPAPGHPIVGPSGLRLAGAAVAAAAIAAGVGFAAMLPGFGQAAWYDVGNLGGGTTLTDNPMVTIRSNLTEPGDVPLLQTQTTRPVYLKTASLDVYSANEEWTTDGIRGRAVGDGSTIPFETEIAEADRVGVQVRIDSGLQGAVLVPAPYQTESLSGAAVERLQYDQSLSTFTAQAGLELGPGDSYTAIAQVPAPTSERAQSVDVRGGDYTQLPSGVPGSVVELARSIVADAGAVTPFEQALAIQEELRTWQYSLEPPPGHGGSAMERFITERVGYCEQYAGTMAVMLRALDVPARVAVGFTPGEAVGPAEDGLTQYEVTDAHAHAWVEALLPGLGWISFEPTPRDDGNVLVPTAANLAPAQTAAQATEDVEQPELDDQPAPDDEFLDDLDEPASAEESSPEDSEVVTVPEQPVGGSWTSLALAVLGGLVSLATIALVALRRRGAVTAGLPPSAAVLAERQHLERLGHGLGIPPAPQETDAEWLRRLVGPHPAGATMARCCETARYAPATDSDVATRAREAAAAVRTETLRGHRTPQIWLIELRGALRMALRRAGAAARGRVSPRTGWSEAPTIGSGVGDRTAAERMAWSRRTRNRTTD